MIQKISKIGLWSMCCLTMGCATLAKEEIKEFPVAPTTCDSSELSRVGNLKLSHIRGVEVKFEREVVKVENQYYWMSSYRPLMACIDSRMPSKISKKVRELEEAEQQKTTIYLSLYGTALGTLVAVPGGAVIAGTIPVATAYVYDLIMGNKRVELQKLVDEYNETLARKLVEQ